MFTKFLQTNLWAAVILLAARLYIGWTWLTSGIGKLTGGFDASGYLQFAIAEPVVKDGHLVYPFYVWFLENVALPNAGLFSAMVMWGEILVGLGLIVGLFTTTAAFFGSVMNVSFLLAGTVSVNPLLLLIAVFIMAAKGNAGKLGLDYVAGPVLKRKLKRKPHLEVAS
ncbi:DoxX family protein [Bacillus altitudinis MN12]|uniref:DoxX family protein n=1 Tax=Bacillus TaxID=1386 RepID=UPI00062566EB|nr:MULTISPECIES: DoxX family protein [Bacillus]KKK09147.1 Crp/Fnr family transcriptional regulator [Bacillus sp. L_1B0_12]MBR0584522.1 DoxX family protein [Bacillus altitudinis MN12]MBR0595533.1 DoxX family protein [Bacillus altitudinis C16B11]MBR0610924.1 DoxX family protein [Bacillus altitudinis]NOL31681.1 DoxX family protein [Bacillus altitudinis]